MKAAVYFGIGDIRVADVPAPNPDDNNMIAKVLYCAICGTDLKTFTVGNPKFKPPIILGHEMVCELVHIGSSVRGFKPGEYITLATTVPCGSCAYCAKGLSNICLNAKPISSYYNGAFAEFIEIPHHAIEMGCAIKITDTSDLRRYALCEPLSCAINAQDNVNVSAGDVVAIIGGGPLGAIHAELAKSRGAKKVIVADLSEKRINLMKRLKDIAAVNVSDLRNVIDDATDGIGADVVIVCAPAASAFEDSISYVRKGGGVCFFASLPPGREYLNLNSRTIHYNELRIVGASDSRSEHVKQAVALISSGDFDCDAILTHEVLLDNIIDGINLMAKQESLKVLVRP